MPQFTVEATKGGKPVTLRITAESEQDAAEKAMLSGHKVLEVDLFDPDIQVVHNATGVIHSAASAELLHATLLRSLLQDIDQTHASYKALLNVSIDTVNARSRANISSMQTNMLAWGFIGGGSLALMIILALLRAHNPTSIAVQLVWILGAIGVFAGLISYLYFTGLRSAKARREDLIREAHAANDALEAWKNEQYASAQHNPAGYVRATLPEEIQRLRPKS